MERRDYLEKEIEKMQAVLQKIFRLRVDKEEEAQEIITTELKRYFDISREYLFQMDETEFRQFIQSKNVSLIDFLGSLLYASVDLQTPLSKLDKETLHKTLIAWDTWELKTRTLDLERLEEKRAIMSALTESIL
jgi:glutamyl-tRNA reductase